MGAILPYLPHLLVALLTAAAAGVYARMAGLRMECVMPRRLGRERHGAEVPWLGGLPILLGALSMLMAADLAARPDLMTPPEAMARERAGIAAGLLILFFWGLAVDRRRASPLWMLPAQAAAILVVAAAGVRIEAFAPLGWTALGPAASLALTFAWLFIVMNFIRFLDGIDGLPEGAAALIIALHLAQTPGPTWTFLPLVGMIFLGALVGALPLGLYPARLYLGQNGSSLPGFMVGIVSIIARQKSVLTVTFVLPAAIVFITLAIIGLRLLERQLLMREKR